jgi:hypothetical protein
MTADSYVLKAGAMDDGTERWHGSVRVVAAVAKYVDRAPVGVGSPVINAARLLRADEQASVLFVGVVAVTVAVAVDEACLA